MYIVAYHATVDTWLQWGRAPTHGVKKLSGEQTAWRIHVGDYRVIYDVFDAELVVTVVRAGHRREVYDR
ncbi:type II toxin-antitoxin system RelE/ParE family toxin [Corynebacterium sp. L4756]|uniref:type II toxin-antitoxin system RelE family toxin n=1 Tax=unclassified Corynebacterium TaxID=2624378 RepID=UPI00374D071C